MLLPVTQHSKPSVESETDRVFFKLVLPWKLTRCRLVARFVMVTVSCDLFMESLSHVGDASLVKITIGANAYVHANSGSKTRNKSVLGPSRQ